MSDQRNGGIAWTDETWNPLRGCSRVSSGCEHCYAERMASRFSKPGEPYAGLTRNGRWTGEVRLIEEHLTDPLRWKRPRRVFVNSMSDLFHPSVPDEWIDRIFAVMALASQHTYQILTKRPERMREYFRCDPRNRIGCWAKCGAAAKADMPWLTVSNWPLPNVWLGVSVEDQKAADERIPILLDTPAAVRWVSIEPMIGPVHLRPSAKFHFDTTPWLPRLDWVVVGGESGPGARPMKPNWVRWVRDECKEADVPFLFKQWGEYAPYFLTPDQECLSRVGKKAAGRELDGRIWDEYPEVKACL